MCDTSYFFMVVDQMEFILRMITLTLTPDNLDSDQDNKKVKPLIHPINDYITKHFNTLWKMVKYGDLIEDVAVSGDRSTGRYIVDKNRHLSDHKKGLFVNELYTEVDDYGSVLPNMYTITKFPIGYFDDLVTNNHFCPDVEKYSSYWHSDVSLSFFDIKFLKLNKLTTDNVYVKAINKINTISYIVLTYKKTNYLIGLIDYSHRNKMAHNEKEKIKEFIDIFKKHNWFYSEAIDEHMIKLAKSENVNDKNIFLIDSGFI